MIEIILKSGIENVSIDLIYNILLDNETFLKEELKFVKEFFIDYLSVYVLSVEKNMNLEKNVKKFLIVDFDNVVREVLEGFFFK